MKVSEQWLREWVDPQLSTEELVAQITMAGLEVDATEPVAGAFSGVVVGQIISLEQHPDADKLRVCLVAGNGPELTQVVCGAANARAGLKIPFATVGAELPPGEDGKPFKIKKAKLRGVESFGMLCGQTELLVGDDDSGLFELPDDAPVGTDLREYLQLDDTVIEVDLTPNRSDCLSVKGIARDIGVLNREPVVQPAIVPVDAAISDVLPVELVAGDACSRYAGRVIRNVDLSRPTPLWMQERLRRAGLRSIDAVVDVTNYVLLELGQPMHAFDLGTLEGGIVVRMAEQGEVLTLLDGQDLTLNADTLVIADQRKPLAAAGIMGGKASAVSATTKDIFFESAFFAPIAVAGRARSYGLHTDSSHRFERGVDWQLQVPALERATQLLLDIAGGEAGPVILAESESKPAVAQVRLRRERILKGLGFAMADEEVLDILTRLGLLLVSTEADGWTFTVPSYRFDISIEEDLLEELARIYGYNRLPTTSLTASLSLQPQTETLLGIRAVRQQLIARGFQEAITYSFVEPSLQALLDPDNAPIEIQNPISAELAVMRTSLWAGLVGALQHNLNRQQTRAKLFESGLRFVRGESGVAQESMLAGLIYGARDAESWAGKSADVDFFDLKGDLESVLGLTGKSGAFGFRPARHPALHPGQTAEVVLDGEGVGLLGALHPQVQQQLGLTRTAYVFEIRLSAVSSARLPAFRALSRFPEVRRDIAVVVDQVVAAADLSDTIRNVAGEALRDLKVFDVYVGKGIDSHRKSIALGLTFQHPSRTLTEDEINTSMDVVVKALEDAFGANLR